jgi:TolB protein
VYQAAPLITQGASAPRWSPDGRQIAFTASDSILIMNADGSGRRLVGRAIEAHSLAWSPDGHWLAGVRENSQFVYGNLALMFGNLAPSTVFVIPAAGGSPRMISDSTTLNISPVWLGDSRGVLYVSSSGGGRDIYEQRIDPSGLVDGPPRRITTGLDAHTIALSRDGRRLAYSKYTRDVNIWMVRVPPGGRASVRTAVQLTRGNQAIETVRLSPDGKWLAFDSDLNGNADIFVVSAEGGAARQLTDDPADDVMPDWSPDGSQLAFHSMRTGRRSIFTMNADGTGLTTAASSPANEKCCAVWTTNNSLGYMRFGSNSGAVEEVTRADRAAPWGRPRVLAFPVFANPWPPITGATPDHSAYLALGEKGFPMRVPSDGGPATPLVPRRVLPLAIYSRMPGDGRMLYYFASDSAGLYIGAADLAHATTRKVITFDEPGRDLTRGEFDTDGNRFFFTIAHHQTDIWVADVERH